MSVKGDTTVSVVLPALDEASTVADIVERVVALRGRLVDQVVVIDGGSTDGTPEIAAAAGADVVTAADLLPRFGPPAGKGDSLWRSLTVVRGDIVAFCDTDIRDFDSRFVWALLGPLLTIPEVHYVKAFYDRPVELDGILHATGGGRVTELTARPLINLFWPELAGVVQPLSGEYAGRTATLRRLPFFTGYGVELGMLVDLLDLLGADAIAQVDLATRLHRNQTVQSLSRMAFAITTVAARRLQREGRLSGRDELPARYQQFERDGGRVHERPTEVPVAERPPIVEIGVAAGSSREPNG